VQALTIHSQLNCGQNNHSDLITATSYSVLLQEG